MIYPKNSNPKNRPLDPGTSRPHPPRWEFSGMDLASPGSLSGIRGPKKLLEISWYSADIELKLLIIWRTGSWWSFWEILPGLDTMSKSTRNPQLTSKNKSWIRPLECFNRQNSVFRNKNPIKLQSWAQNHQNLCVGSDGKKSSTYSQLWVNLYWVTE